MTAYVTDVCERCGNLRSVCSDPNVTWYPQRAVCHATAVAEQMYRRTAKLFKHPNHDDDSAHVTDGMQWWTSVHDLTQEDDFFGQSTLLGGAVAGEQPPGDEH
jgi:hypothetical protein